MLSFLASGLSSKSTGKEQLAGVVASSVSLMLLATLAFLAFRPSWPLAAGSSVAWVSAILVFRLVLSHTGEAAPRGVEE